MFPAAVLEGLSPKSRCPNKFFCENSDFLLDKHSFSWYTSSIEAKEDKRRTLV